MHTAVEPGVHPTHRGPLATHISVEARGESTTVMASHECCRGWLQDSFSVRRPQQRVAVLRHVASFRQMLHPPFFVIQYSGSETGVLKCLSPNVEIVDRM
jgi:hypothetical protein